MSGELYYIIAWIKSKNKNKLNIVPQIKQKQVKIISLHKKSTDLEKKERKKYQPKI